MPKPEQSDRRNDAINKLAAEANIVDVAEWLDLRVVGRGTRSPKTLCPFHEDQRPSLHLYAASGGGRPQFHCFACGAHGDVFDLIKRQSNTDFRGALEWLANRYRVTLPSSVPTARGERLVPRARGLDLGLKIYGRQTPSESEALQQWAAERDMEASALRGAEVFAAFPPKIARSRLLANREQLDALDAAGLIRREAAARGGESSPLPLEMEPRDFYSSPRILFTIRDDRGAVSGFAGRAIGNELPKYLFSPGFPRASTLYRFHKARAGRPSRGAKGRSAIAHLFVVEGLMDALRLEMLGLHAVAILGSQISTEQVGLLIDYARELDRDGLQLAVHVLLDADESGRRGAINAVVRLLDASVETPGMLLDALTPPVTVDKGASPAHDPDELFRGVNSAEEALTRLKEWCEAPMKLLLASALEVSPQELNQAWDQLPEGQQLRAFRDVERRLDRARWVEILDRFPAFECHLRPATPEKPNWEEPLRRFLRAARGRTSGQAVPVTAVAKDEDGRLIRALQIAEASTQRREFPVDEGSWDRLQAAVDVTIPHLRGLLERAGNPQELDADPMLAVLVPKGDSRFRLKALPSPEILSLQQYVLDELLRDYSDCPRFRRFIPGVRFTGGNGDRRLETTGPEQLVPVDGEAVSFAYTLDMDVIEHRAPPRRTGMFRSYFECWRDFIGFIDSRVAAFPSGKFHVARLDVRSFYDTVTRPVVNAVLLSPVSDALAELAESDSTRLNSALDCAPHFRPTVTDPQERALALVDWLCDQSFGYKFEQPGTIPQPVPVGLPQGPDLSAYLANISLFPLDRALSELVAKIDRQTSEEHGEAVRHGETPPKRGAVYARYVDDMVIIARTGHDLARLRTAIEQQLALVGMELSPKTDPLPVMDEAGVREWLTDRRGAALGVSGPFAGPPVNAPLSLLEPLADAGETDRADSLRILHDPRLDDPETSLEELECAVEAILAAPDLRHGDRAAAARHLWHRIIQEMVETGRTPAEATTNFVRLWETNKMPARAQDVSPKADDGGADLIVWLDGIERFLTSRQDRNPTFSDEKHATLRKQRTRMAELVHAGLVEHLIKRCVPACKPSQFDHMLELKALVIHRAATLVLRPSEPTAIKIEAGISCAKARLLISLAEAQESPTLLDRAGWRAPEMPLGILFHEAVARLRIANRASASQVDPLMPVGASMKIWQQRGEAEQPLEKVLNLWMTGAPAIADTDCTEAALSAFVNLVPRRAVDLLDKREALKSFALSGTPGQELSFLPTPPGLDVPGLLGLREENRVVVRADFRNQADLPFCPPLPWIDKGEGSGGKLKRFESPLGDFKYLTPPSHKVTHVGTTRWLASAFRSLASSPAHSGQQHPCPPTASNLLGPTVGEETNESQWEVLGFCVPSARISGQAFLRQGDGSVMLEPVIALHDDLWRAGTALADWLGRAESTRQLSSQRLAAPALVTDDDEDWAREAMLRFSLCRLRGKSLPARPLRLSQQNGLPLTVERVLQRLKNFPISREGATGEAGIAHLLATLAEGRAIQTRIEARIDPSTPGGATALLAEMVRGQFRTDEELAHRLPASDVAIPAWAPGRRPARALCALAQRLTVLAELDPMHDDDLSLSALASGTRLLALEAQLRSQALELWSLLDLTAQLKFQETPPSLAAWNLDSTALLHREQPKPQKGTPVPTDGRNVHGLFLQLHLAMGEGQRVRWESIAGITPLGWLVVIGSLSGALAGEWRGGLVDQEKLGADGVVGLATLAADLALAGADDDDLPWGGLEAVIGSWDSARLQQAFVALEWLDRAAGLRVETHESSRFYLEASRRRATEVQTSDGRRHLPGWAITWAKAFDESRGGIERVAPPAGEDRAIFRWTETWCGDRIIGIGVVQPAMVALAGNAFADARRSSLSVVPPADSNPAKSSAPMATLPTEPDTTNPVAPEPPPADEPPADEPPADEPPADEPPADEPPADEPPADEPPADEPPADEPPADEPPAPIIEHKPPRKSTTSSLGRDWRASLSEVRKLQDDYWPLRKEKSKSHARIALFQWEVDETYRHPGFDVCDRGASGFDRRKPESLVTHSYLQSCAEHRRRGLLRAALKACNRFKVDILLLPEYSVRPDTVDWLAKQVAELAPNTSVWAGTYRVPPRMVALPSVPAWSAIHEAVLSEGKRNSRAKRYPAAAADEVFNPGNGEMNPLFTDQANDDVRSYIYELICSEVFLVSCPANLRPLARVRRELMRKFNSGERGRDLDELINQDVMGDIEKFALHTGISENLGIRRTILLVPAMTSRSADYSVLGQAGFLSSGLTTVFCNAVYGSYGHGQSCFIGHDGWIDEKEAAGFATFEPYHGARPGIFHLDRRNRGRLGKQEQALVIADIDPIYGPEGKPRPQTLLKPLQLVAHLPVIESWQPKQGASSAVCRCRRVGDNAPAVTEFAHPLFEALQRGITGNWLTTMDDPDPKILGDALEKLAECAGVPHSTDESNRGWLLERKKSYVANHLADPNPWPPPAALDWMWIDHGPFDPATYPEIEVPPYAMPPGGDLRVESPSP